MTKYYVDTSIWRDLHENRTDKFRPLGDWAFEFFRQVRAEEGIILFSDLVMQELLIAYNKEEIHNIFEIAEGFLEEVIITRKQKNLSEKIGLERGLPAPDVLHAILARDNSSILVSRDKHFLSLLDICKVRKP